MSTELYGVEARSSHWARICS